MRVLKRIEDKLLRGVCFIDGGSTPGPSGATGGGGDGGAGGTGAAASSPTAPVAPASPSSPAQAEPAPVTPSQVSGEVREDEDVGMQDFSGFPERFESTDFDDVVLPAEPAQAPPKPQAPQAPVEAQPAPAAPAAPQAATPQTAEVPQAPVSQEPPDPTKLEDFQRGMGQHRGALIEHLASTTFALSDQEKQALDTDAVGAIPKIMARVHLDAVIAATQNIHAIVPKLVSQILDRRSRSEEADKEFYDSWKQLNKSEHGSKISAYAKLFRAANPQASRQQAIQAVGRMVCGELGIPLNPALAAAPQGTAQPQTPRAAPFAPARPGTSAPVTNIVEESPFVGMGRDYDD